MRTTAGARGGRRAGVLACGALLAAIVAGCAQSVPGTPHPEGEGPTTSTGPSAEAAPPTDFSEPSGRPTVTVQPDVTEPLIPGPLSTVPPTPTPPPPSTPAPTSRPTPAPDPTDRADAPPLAAGPTGSDGSARADRSRPPGSAPRAESPQRVDGAGQGADRPKSPATTPDAAASPSPGGRSAPVASAAPGPRGAGPDAPLPGQGAPAAPPPGAGTPGGPATPETTLLTADVLDDECLLDAGGFAALLGGPVGKPAEAAVVRPDSSSTRACYATSRAGSPTPTAAINVYTVNRGTPAAFVRAAGGGRPIAGVGEAAALLDTVGGTTLQVATSRYLVTVNVVDASPSAERWATAGRAVAAALARP